MPAMLGGTLVSDTIRCMGGETGGRSGFSSGEGSSSGEVGSESIGDFGSADMVNEGRRPDGRSCLCGSSQGGVQ